MIRLLFRGGLVSTILVIDIAYVYWDYVLYILLGVFMVFVLKKVTWLIQKIHRLNQNLRLQDVDSMDGISFEYYIAQLLAERGYSNISLTEQYDYGVDIIAEKDGVRWGVQTKRYSGLVKAEAVRQVVTGLRLYGCDRAMVVTNSTYSNVARRLAEGNDCVLIDRDGLAALAN